MPATGNYAEPVSQEDLECFERSFAEAKHAFRMPHEWFAVFLQAIKSGSTIQQACIDGFTEWDM